MFKGVREALGRPTTAAPDRSVQAPAPTSAQPTWQPAGPGFGRPPELPATALGNAPPRQPLSARMQGAVQDLQYYQRGAMYAQNSLASSAGNRGPDSRLYTLSDKMGQVSHGLQAVVQHAQGNTGAAAQHSPELAARLDRLQAYHAQGQQFGAGNAVYNAVAGLGRPDVAHVAADIADAAVGKLASRLFK